MPESLPIPSDRVVGVGSGLEYLDRMPARYQEILVDLKPDIYPRAGAIAELAVFDLQEGILQQPDDVNPVYLRDKVTHN